MGFIVRLQHQQTFFFIYYLFTAIILFSLTSVRLLIVHPLIVQHYAEEIVKICTTDSKIFFLKCDSFYHCVIF